MPNTVLELIDEMTKILKKDKNFYEIVIKGTTTDVRIVKPDSQIEENCNTNKKEKGEL